MNDLITKVKRCSKKENCIHPAQVLDGWLPATSEYFGKDKGLPDGFNCSCKKCVNKASADFRRRNPEKRKLNSQKYHQKNRERINAQGREKNKTPERKEYKKQQREKNSEHISQLKKEWYAEHKEHVLEKVSKWQRENKDKVKIRNDKWTSKNPEKRLAGKHRRRAKIFGNGGSYTPEDIDALIRDQLGLCYYCGNQLTKYHIDHVIPLFKNGTNNPENLVCACVKCNLSKGRRTPSEWVVKIKNEELKSRVYKRIQERDPIIH